MLVNSDPFIKYRGTQTVSSPGTASLGWRADALVPCFLLATKTISSWHETLRPLIGTWYRQDKLPWPKTLQPPTGTGKKHGTSTPLLRRGRLPTP